MSEGSHILKLRNEAFEADELWRMRDIPDGMQPWFKAREEVARAEESQPTKKRKKKVVKTSLTPRYIETLRRLLPFRTCPEMSDEELSRESEQIRRMYAMRKYIDGKWTDYLKALVEQYDLTGHAEDECEFTDDEDDDVVKMRALAIR